MLYVDSQCHCAPWEDKDSIEEAGVEQRAAQDTLTDSPVFVPSPPFIHTTDTVFSFSPLPALSCQTLVFSLPLPPILLFTFFLCVFRAGWLALESASEGVVERPRWQKVYEHSGNRDCSLDLWDTKSTNLKEAQSGCTSNKWQQVMVEELDSLILKSHICCLFFLGKQVPGHP